MKKFTLSILLALGLLSSVSIHSQCVANGTLTATGTAGEFTITDLSTISSTGTSFVIFSNGDYVNLQPSTTTATYQFTANGTYNYCFTVMDSLTTFCYDTLCGSITVTGITTPPVPCQSSFTILQDSTNPGIYWCWNQATGSSPASSLSYFWDFGDGTSSTLAYPTHTYSSLGVYTICLTITEANTSCTSTYCDSIIVSVKASGTTLNVLPPGASASIDEVQSISLLKTYPNPVENNFILEFNSSTSDEIVVRIASLTGQIISSTSITKGIGQNKMNINTSDLNSGTYLVSVSDGSNSQTLRIVKK